MATDGQVDTNAGDAFQNGGKKPPPWLNKAKQTTPDDKKNARANVIQKRLAQMGKKGK